MMPLSLYAEGSLTHGTVLSTAGSESSSRTPFPQSPLPSLSLISMPICGFL